MFRKLLTLVIVLAFVLTPLTVRASTDGQGITVKREVADKPSELDKDWPIVREEKIETIDPVTKEVQTHTLVVREIQYAQPVPCETTSAENSAPAVTCTINGERSFGDTSTVGSITSRIVHYTDKVCQGGNCVWNKPKRIEVWWTRTDSRWFASNAYIIWGCYACTICEGGSWDSAWTESPSWTPAWLNNTTSYTYIYTSSSFPGLYPYDGTGDRASIDSDAYYNWTYQGHMLANPGF